MKTINDEFGSYLRQEKEVTDLLQKQDKNFSIEFLRNMSADEEIITPYVLIVHYGDHMIAVIDLKKEFVLVTDIRYDMKFCNLQDIILDYFNAPHCSYLCKDYQN